MTFKFKQLVNGTIFLYGSFFIYTTIPIGHILQLNIWYIWKTSTIMAYTEDFTVSLIGSGTLTFVDTSTGSDPNLTGRQISLIRSDGSTIVPANNPAGQTYIDWTITDPTKTLLNILTRDYALNIRVTAISSNPDPAGVYTKTETALLANYGELFMYKLIQQINASYPAMVNADDFAMNFFLLRLQYDSALQAIKDASDIFNAQAALNRAYYMMINRTQYFGTQQ